MTQKQKRLAELENMERNIWAAYERGEITDEELNFELDGIALSESLILNKPY